MRKPGTEPRERLTQRSGRLPLVTGIEQGGKRGGEIATDTQYAKAVAVKELKMRVPLRQLAPQLENAKIAFADVRVVKKHDRPWCKLRSPSFIIVSDCIVSMKTVYME